MIEETPIAGPYAHAKTSVSRTMALVMLALLPGVAVYFWLFGWGVLFNLLIAISVCLSLEAVILKMRQRDVPSALNDGSALLTACLLALAFTASAAPLTEISIVKKYADRGDPEAQFVLGKLHARGIGVEQSDDKSIEWFLKAARAGLPQAQNRIGKLYLDGAGGLPEDHETAFEWFSKAAAQIGRASCRERV